MTGIIEESSILRPDLKPLSPMMVLSTLKKLFILEIAFYDGASILESTHQCIFLWPASWEHLLLSSLDSSDVKDSLLLRFLCAYCAQLLQTMGFVHKLVLDADIYQGKFILYRTLQGLQYITYCI